MFNFVPHYQFILKVVRKLTSEFNVRYKLFPFNYRITNRLKKYLQKVDKDSFKNKLENLLGDFEHIQNFDLEKSDREIILQNANYTMNHKFDLLGSGWIKNTPIDWHTDFKTNFTWTKGKFYKNYKVVDYSNNSDIKVVWELSRCHHLLWLGEAYLITKEEKYAKEVIFQIEDWLNENPLMYSVNWTCAMDVAIRIVNWMYAINMISSSEHLTDSFAKSVTKSMYEHGFFIYNNLEKATPYSSNHYASNLTGLLFVSKFLNDSELVNKWYKFSLHEFYSEIRNQILPSGVQYERSTSYHRLVTELFSYTYFMLVRNEVAMPNDIHTRIKTIFGFVRNYIKPNGKAVLFGDNDNGRLLPFVMYDFNDHNYLLDVASNYYSGARFTSENEPRFLDSFFILNGIEKKKVGYSENTNSSLTSIVYADAGFAILRRNDFYLFFTNSGLSKYPSETNGTIGTHTHGDALSFELSIGENDFIVDPGSYCYTSSKKDRNEFKSTKKHNTISVDDLDQFEFDDNNVFAVKGFEFPEIINYSNENGNETLQSHFHWNTKEEKNIVHNREITLSNNDELNITDTISCDKQHDFALYYHFSEKLDVELIDKKVILKTRNGDSLVMEVSSEIDLNLSITNDTISPSFGIIKESKTLNLKCSSKGDFMIKTAFTHIKKK